MTRIRNSYGVVLTLSIAIFVCTAGAHAQESPRRIALKGGESVVLREYSFVAANCQSIMVGTPTLDVLEGPEELSLALKGGTVIRRDRGCAAPLPGGQVVATAKEIKEPKEAKLTIRLNFHTKDGERQSSDVYIISLFP